MEYLHALICVSSKSGEVAYSFRDLSNPLCVTSNRSVKGQTPAMLITLIGLCLMIHHTGRDDQQTAFTGHAPTGAIP